MNMRPFITVIVIVAVLVAVSCDKKDSVSSDNDQTLTDIDGNVYQIVKIGTK